MDEAASWLGLPAGIVEEAVRMGQIPALALGGYVRISREALLALGRGAPAAAPIPPGTDADDGVDTALPEPDAPADAVARPEVPQPAGLEWLEDLVKGATFTHYWPQTGGGSFPERYAPTQRGRIILHGERFNVRVGECERVVGMQDERRGRLVVFFGQVPVAQFVETPDGTAWASLIKPNGKRVLTPGERPPPLYRRSRVAPYRAATGLEGRGIPKGMAAIIARDDLRSAVHHTAARWLGLHGLPVRAA